LKILNFALQLFALCELSHDDVLSGKEISLVVKP